MLFDLIVIGSGPAGQKAALQGAKAGKKVAVIEQYSVVGGGCVHLGTLPSKSFRESVYRWSLGSKGSLGGRASENALAKGAKASGLPDMARLLRRRDRVVSDETQVIHDQLKRNGVTVLHGHATLTSNHDVAVASSRGTEQLKGSVIMIAVGSRPVAPGHLPIDGKNILDSDTILNLKKLPKSMVVLGAGIIGCEYASMFGMAGTKVYLVDRRHEIMAAVDREIVDHLVERYQHQGTEVVLEAEAKEIEYRPSRGKSITAKGGVFVHLTNGRRIPAEVVLIAQGRAGNTENLGLEAAGVKVADRGLIPVNEFYQTNVPNIYAVGDVVGPPALASTSMEQGRVACCHAFRIEDAKLDPFHPYGIYTIPEIAMVGATEAELKSQRADFVVGRAHYRELARGQIVGDRWGLLKMLVDRKSLKILGVHIIGDNAADLIHIGQAVMALGGTVQYFIGSVFNYPTLAEAYKTAAFHAVNQIKGVATKSSPKKGV